jgi:hypothetical protein
MRLALPLLVVASAITLTGQAVPSEVIPLNNLTIPVELNKGIKADKAHPGDEVHLRMAEAVLAGKGVVIPDGAKLYGHILRASPAKDGKHSHLSIMIERAEWKGHTLPLHAFVVGWGRRRRVVMGANGCGPEPTDNSPRRIRGGTTAGITTSAGPTDCDDASKSYSFGSDYLASGINIFKNPRSGATVLVSSKNIHLPGGMLLLLRNVSEGDIAGNLAQSSPAPKQ